MSFKPAHGKRYFLIAKHSNLPLGVRGNSGAIGTDIEQQAWNLESMQPQQHFWFDGAPELHFYLKPGHRDLYLEPVGAHEGHGREDGTHIVQAHWNANAESQRFRLIPAGQGYYRIQCRHTEKFWDVAGVSTAAGAVLTQYHYIPGGDNQLFRPVLVLGEGRQPDQRSFQEVTESLRRALVRMASAGPGLGTGIGDLLRLLWPTDHDRSFWQQQTEYVDARLAEFLRPEQLAGLEKRLFVLAQTLRQANNTALPTADRWGSLVATVAEAAGIQRDFLLPGHVESKQLLSHLVAWGTLVLAAHSQLVRDYDALHPGTPEAERSQGKAVYQQQLQTALSTFSSLLAAARAETLHARAAAISMWSTKDHCAVVDYHTGWQKGFHAHEHNLALESYHARQRQMAVQLEAELDALLAPARLWRFLDPTVTERPAAETVRRAVGPVPGLLHNEPVDDIAGTISSISIGARDQAFFGAVVTYTNGRRCVTGREYAGMSTLTLEPGEYFCNAYGVERHTEVASLTLETNRGRVLSTGPQPGARESLDFKASLDDNLEARLTGLSYSCGGLCLHWEYGWAAE
jgi:hypothetical protein